VIGVACPVRGCQEGLTRGARVWSCPRGHSFDVARSGYVNLLQPQDSRSRHPGDSRQVATARRRVLEGGHGAALAGALLGLLADHPPPPNPALLDIGCGEGYLLEAVATGICAEAHGLDISAAAVDLAARRHPGGTWIVANADRTLPYPDGSFDLIMSLTAVRNPVEYRRVLKPAGLALLAVPGPDDLIELRRTVLGEGILIDRMAGALAALAGFLEPVDQRVFRQKSVFDPDGLRDLLVTTYRGLRHSRRGAVDNLRTLEVTLSRDIALLRPVRGD
jgi:23S rRNA (guanine745-N1)-methyltransferase